MDPWKIFKGMANRQLVYFLLHFLHNCFDILDITFSLVLNAGCTAFQCML